MLSHASQLNEILYVFLSFYRSGKLLWHVTISVKMKKLLDIVGAFFVYAIWGLTEVSEFHCTLHKTLAHLEFSKMDILIGLLLLCFSFQGMHMAAITQ